MEFSNQFLAFWSAIALISFFFLFFKTAPYGRYIKPDLRNTIPSRLGWIVMETPTIYLMVFFIFFFLDNLLLVQWVFVGVWLLHYLHRSLIWPIRARIKQKKMTLLVVILAFIFNTVNVSIQAIWIFKFGNYETNWLYSFPFITGLFIFLVGMYINIRSDNILFNLRKVNGPGYHLPRGFLFNKVSSPNYLGEFIEWLGWAIMTWNLAGLIFFVWTVANLLPRAVSNHKWYKENFDNYPDDRKIIIPNFY